MRYTLKVVDKTGNINYPVNLSVIGLGDSAIYEVIDIKNPRVVSFDKSKFPLVDNEIKRINGYGFKAEIVESYERAGTDYHIDEVEGGFQIMKCDFDKDNNTFDFYPVGNIVDNFEDLDKECQRLNTEQGAKNDKKI